MIRFLLAAAPAALLMANAAAQPVAYEFDKSHTLIQATWRHAISSQALQFTDYDGTLALDLQAPENSQVDVSFNLIDGIWAGAHHAELIAHLNSPDFFETAVNPTARFVSTSFTTDDRVFGIMTGDLTMNGVTHPVTLEVVLNGAGHARDGRPKRGFTATATIQRSQWDMGFATEWGVSDEVELLISTELVAME